MFCVISLLFIVMIVDEEVEDLEEEDLDCEGEMDPESPPWDIYGEEDIDCEVSDEIDEHENTALLRASAAKTEIVITPMSPVSKSITMKIIFKSYKTYNFSILQNASTLDLAPRPENDILSQHISSSGSDAASSSSNVKTMDLLKPDMASTNILMPSEGV